MTPALARVPAGQVRSRSEAAASSRPPFKFELARKPRALRVLVTGADGFIGGHIARGLRAAGHAVTGAVYARAPRRDEVAVDLTRPEQLVRLPCDVDAVVHAAGIVDASAPARVIFDVNLRATAHLLQWARRRAVGHFVQLSSVAVYGPLVVGEDRAETTPRLGAALGLPYMRSKARAERLIEASGVPYTLLRPPAVVGPGDTVVSGGFVRALRGAGLPFSPTEAAARRVSLCFVDGLVDLSARVLQRGPLYAAVHAVDAQLTLLEAAELYARALRTPLYFAPLGFRAALRNRNDAGLSWLFASARFGQHYTAERARRELGDAQSFAVEDAISAAVRSLV